MDIEQPVHHAVHRPQYSASAFPDSERQGLYYAPRSQGWRLKDIDWKFVFGSQHYGTIIWYPSLHIPLQHCTVQESHHVEMRLVISQLLILYYTLLKSR